MKGKRSLCLSPSVTARPVGAKSAPFRFRLVRAIANPDQNITENATTALNPNPQSTRKAPTFLNPNQDCIDSVTQFWMTYKKIADEHDSDMLAQYIGDLDTSLLFVSVFAASHMFSLT